MIACKLHGVWNDISFITFEHLVTLLLAPPQSASDYAPISCPDQYIGARPYAGDCRRYVYCWNGIGRVESCLPGHTFSELRQQCEAAAGGHVDCRQTEPCPVFDCQLIGVCVAAEQLCNGVDDCGNRLDEQNCPGGADFRLQLLATDNRLDNNSGVLLAQLYGVDGAVCGTGFGIREASVACRQLGFRLGARRVGRLGTGSEAAEFRRQRRGYHMD